jgi:hypothetical protein
MLDLIQYYQRMSLLIRNGYLNRTTFYYKTLGIL